MNWKRKQIIEIQADTEGDIVRALYRIIRAFEDDQPITAVHEPRGIRGGYSLTSRAVAK